LKRLLLRLVVAAVMGAMVLAMAAPAWAVKPSSPPVKPDQPDRGQGVYYCTNRLGETVASNIPRGQVSEYEALGYICFR
jgi:hypothetical protein